MGSLFTDGSILDSMESGGFSGESCGGGTELGCGWGVLLFGKKIFSLAVTLDCLIGCSLTRKVISGKESDGDQFHDIRR